MIFVRLRRLAVLDVIGKDASRIANNLCTADTTTLEIGVGREAFVTDVRGKTLGHVSVFRTEDGLRLIGAGANDALNVPNQSLAIAAHFDRYTLREQAVPVDRSAELAAIVMDSELAASFPGGDWEQGYQMPWWRDGCVLQLCGLNSADALVDILKLRGGVEASEVEFHRRRIENRFPWYGVDLDASHLPQEADRDLLAISFTKGCYLGQETVARLDALGQVQKKLVRWDLKCESMPLVNTELRAADRAVGRLTSVAASEDKGNFVALGYARRSHFEPGGKAFGTNTDGSIIEATVSALP